MKGFTYSAATTIGKRARQEDACVCVVGRDLDLLAVADGVGGEPGGARAAQVAVQAAMECFNVRGAVRLGEVQQELSSDGAAQTLARAIICQAVAQVSALGEGSTTLVFALVSAQAALIASIGDSRAWLDGVPLTLPHNLPGHANIITSSVPNVRAVDFRFVEVDATSTLVLCSDGIYPEHFVWRASPSRDAAALVRKQLRLEESYQDNATVVMRSPGRDSEGTRPRVVGVRTIPLR